MRRAVVLGPLVLYATGCAFRPFTPAVSVESYGQDSVEAPAAVTVPAKSDAIARWQLPPANPWASYQKLTLLASLDEVPRAAILPDVARLEVVDRARLAATNVAASGLAADTMWVVDLRGAASVVFGAVLSVRMNAPPSLVLTFNNWPHENELIPAEETLAALVLVNPKFPDPTAVTNVPVFLLDAWRLAYRDESVDDDVTDNRYMISSSDLPLPEMLSHAGIRRLIYVVEDLDDTDTEEDDLHGPFLSYQAAGIEVCMVDLDMLSARAPHACSAFKVEERRTVVEDAGFYVRSRGGFGGSFNGPSPFGRYYWGDNPARFGAGG